MTNNEAENDFSTWEDLDQVIGPIEWDWLNWQAKGFLHLLVAVTGEGKSQVAERILGCYLKGWDWPDGTPYTGNTGYVIWCEAEAAQALNLERAKKMGLPLDQILSPLGDPLADFRLNNKNHLAKFEQLLMRPDVLFAVVDSLSGADPTAEKSTEDAKNVNWLAGLARNAQKPIQLTHHLRKRGLFDTEGVITLDRIRGISTILQYARIIWALDTPNLMDKETKRLSVIKSNLGKKPDPIGLKLDDSGVTFCEAPQLPKAESIQEKGIDLLMSLLNKGPLSTRIIDTEFEGAGLSTRTLKEVKKALSVVSFRKADGWYCSLPVKKEGI
jgi:hypothetical protein